jgi:hypothetical protein
MSKSKRNIVAVDFDDTISPRKQGWLEILASFKACGYEVIIVTYRQPNCSPEELNFLVENGYPVYFTGQVAKRPFLKKLGIKPAIWIDDLPESILYDYSTYKGKYSKNENHDFQITEQKKD